MLREKAYNRFGSVKLSRRKRKWLLIVNVKEYKTETETQILGKDAKTFSWIATDNELKISGLISVHPRPYGLSENRVVNWLIKIREMGTDRIRILSDSVNGWQCQSHN